jgi:aminoglycoside phosphotransferase (APT) family kinase protein
VTEPTLAEVIGHDLGVALAAEAPTRTVAGVELVAGGRSALTAFADVVGPGGAPERVAVRAVARGLAGIAVGTLRDQFALLELLRSEPVLAPRPLLLAEGLDETSYDLLVTSYLKGTVPQPWRRGGREEIALLRSNERFRDDFVTTLASIHHVSAKQLPSGLAHGGESAAATHSTRAMESFASSFEASGVFEDDPVLTYCQLWLKEQRPATTQAAGLLHGDYRMGNLVVDADGRLCGVLDWELAEAGETLSDVAWLCGPQGMVDGYAAGLFGPDELIAAYERASGRSVDQRLFEFLRVEGTMRTAAVWARLSAIELERGEPVVSMRCQESVLELIAMCAKSVGLDPAPRRGDRAPALLDGSAQLAKRHRDALFAELKALDSPQPPAARNAVSFLGRLSAMLASTEYEQYAEACAGIGTTDDTVNADLPAGAVLSAVLRRRHAAGKRLDDPDTDAAEFRRLVAWSASDDIAFANLVSTIGARRAEQ